MKEGLLIGAGVVAAGIFVGFAVCKLIKKNPELLKDTKKKRLNVWEKTSKIAAEAKQAFAEGFDKAQAKVATA